VIFFFSLLLGVIELAVSMISKPRRATAAGTSNNVSV
jgi:hypothetical protein